jgi:two-component system, OmpR family, osmolarity sensor histidine kinase EnvZ
MIARSLKAYMPRSLYGRAVLILLVPVVTILLMVSVVFIQRLYEDVTRQMTEGVANEINLILIRIENASDTGEALRAALEVAAPLGIDISGGDVAVQDSRGIFDLSGRVIAETLRAKVPGVLAVDLQEGGPFVRVAVNTGKGPVLLEVSRNRMSARNPHQFLVLIGFTALLMTLIALVYLRNQMRPIRRLARAAEAFGMGRSVPYRPSGAAEVRLAGAAFLDMRDRIEHQIEQRTMMLSGVSHDLRTPLTRMKLALSLMDGDDDKSAMLKDVQDMERMLDAFLAFAKGAAQEEPESVDAAELVRDAVERAVRGAMPARIGHIGGDEMVMLRPAALARALDNLISNAVRYGNEAVVSVSVEPARVRFMVEDRGPGIPVEKRDHALKPFTRLDPSRNQDGGSGVGLGLAIAADIARQHGGTLLLGESAELGGLQAEISLPR